MKVVLAVDPGATTGLAVASQAGLLYRSQVAPHEVAKRVRSLLPAYLPQIIVVEDFVGGGPRTKWAKLTLEVIGRCLAVAELYAVPVKRQAPQLRKAFLSEAKRLVAGKHADRHAADALAHALRYLNEASGAVPGEGEASAP